MIAWHDIVVLHVHSNVELYSMRLRILWEFRTHTIPFCNHMETENNHFRIKERIYMEKNAVPITINLSRSRRLKHTFWIFKW